MLASSQFETAWRKALEANECPISFLEDFYANHWDVCSLCAAFECRECVADPADIGLGPWDDDPLYGEGDCDLTIPF